MGPRASSGGSCLSAENVAPLPKGSIRPGITINPEILSGKVIRPLRSVNPDQAVYPGLIKTNSGNNKTLFTFLIRNNFIGLSKMSIDYMNKKLHSYLIRNMNHIFFV